MASNPDLQALAERMLALSVKLLDLSCDEQWDQWEHTADQKRLCARQLMRLTGQRPDAQTLKCLDAIRRTDTEICEILAEKQEAILGELHRIRQNKSVVHSYAGKPVERHRFRHHFKIAC